jgi:hypothetical protein
MDKTINCLCSLEKDKEVRAGDIERICEIDHNIAYACLETLAPHIKELDIWNGICSDRRRLIRRSLYVWWLDSPKTTFDWLLLGLCIFGLVLNLGILAWQARRRTQINREASQACNW